MKMTVDISGVSYDVAPRAYDISIPVRFDDTQVSAFGAPAAQRQIYAAGGFVGSVAQGGSCNCETYTVTPHCNGTHTECIGHIARDPVYICDIADEALIPATLVTITPVRQGNDDVITADLVEQALAPSDAGFLAALIVRTMPNSPDKCFRHYDGSVMPPYFAPEAMALIAAQGVRHLLCDLPSVDRMDDGGKLLAHRAFWDTPASRRTITELIYVPDTVIDGFYLLNLQVAAFKADAAPSRPLLYEVKKT